MRHKVYTARVLDVPKTYDKHWKNLLKYQQNLSIIWTIFTLQYYKLFCFIWTMQIYWIIEMFAKLGKTLSIIPNFGWKFTYNSLFPTWRCTALACFVAGDPSLTIKSDKPIDIWHKSGHLTNWFLLQCLNATLPEDCGTVCFKPR